MKDIAIYGVGGFGREVLALIQDINCVHSQWNIVGFFDDGYEKGMMINGYPILGKVDDLNKWKTDISISTNMFRGITLSVRNMNTRVNVPLRVLL